LLSEHSCSSSTLTMPSPSLPISLPHFPPRVHSRWVWRRPYSSLYDTAHVHHDSEVGYSDFGPGADGGAGGYMEPAFAGGLTEPSHATGYMDVRPASLGLVADEAGYMDVKPTTFIDGEDGSYMEVTGGDVDI